jgi:hypothetical protein
MPFDGTPISTAMPSTGTESCLPGLPLFILQPFSRSPEITDSRIAVLRRARDLLAKEQRWCKGSFARTWFNIPVPPHFALFARRFCALGAIMRAGRELQLRTQDACLALQRETVQPVEGWNDEPERTHADVIAAFDAAVLCCERRCLTLAKFRTEPSVILDSGTDRGAWMRPSRMSI